MWTIIKEYFKEEKLYSADVGLEIQVHIKESKRNFGVQ